MSKAAAAFLARERESAQESVGVVLDRLLTEVRRHRKRTKKPTKVTAKRTKVATKRTRKTGRR